MRDTRWFSLAVLAGGLVAVAYGWFSSWFELPADAGLSLEPVRAPTMMVAGYAVVFVVLLGGGIVFAMAAGARRSYLPPAFLQGLLVGLAVVGAGALGHATYLAHQVRSVQLTYYDRIEAKLTLSPWLALSGLALIIVGGGRLWHLTRAVRRRVATERARVDRELAIQQGDVVVAEGDVALVDDPTLRV